MKMNENLNKIINDNLDEILEIVKSKLPRYEPEPDYVIINALKEYFK